MARTSSELQGAGFRLATPPRTNLPERHPFDSQVSGAVSSSLRVTPFGDVDKDGTVRVADLVLVAAALGTEPAAGPIVDWNSDRVVDIKDVALVASRLGRSLALISSTDGHRILSPDSILVDKER